MNFLNILVILLSALISLISFESNIRALFICIPFVYFLKRIQFFIEGTGIYNNPISLLPEILILLGIIRLLLLKTLKKGKIDIDTVSLSISLLILFTFFSSLFNHYGLEVGLFGFRSVGIPIFSFFLGKVYFNSEERIVNFYKLMVTLGLCVAVYGLWQQFVGLPPWDIKWLDNEVIKSDLGTIRTFYFGDMDHVELRKFSTLSHPATAGSWYVITFLFGYILLQITKNSVKLWWMLIMIFLGQLFTYTRAGIVCVILIPLLFEFYKRNLFYFLRSIGRKIFFYITIFAIVFILMTELSERGRYRLLTTTQPLKDGSFITRVDRLWVNSIQRFLMKPVVGWGTGSTGGIAQRFIGYKDNIAVDSLYFKILVEHGIVGSLIWFIVLVIILRKIFYIKKYVTEKVLLNTIVGLIILITIFLLIGIVGCPTELTSFSIPFWFFLGSIKFLEQKMRITIG